MPDNTDLSERELDVLRLVVTGATNRQIAQELSISRNTVKVHLRNIFSKIGVASRTEAAMFAVRHGLVQPNTPPSAQEQVESPGFPPVSRVETETGSGSRYSLWNADFAVVLAGITLLGLLVTGTVYLALFSRPTTPTSIPTQTGLSPQPTPSLAAQWSQRANLATPRSGMAVVEEGGEIYAIGGESQAGIVGMAERYDPEQDRWIPLQDKPTAVAEASAAVVGGRVFVPGGRIQGDRVTDVLEIYDPLDDRWERGASLPTPMSAYALATFEGRLYLFGGWDGDRFLEVVLEYDPSRDLWSEKSPMPTPRGRAGASVAAGLIFVIGGMDDSQALAVNEAFDPTREEAGEDPWTIRASMPEGRYGMGIANIIDSIFIIGGAGDSPQLSSLKYFPEQDQWESYALQLAQSWVDFGFVILGTDLYAFGGRLDGRLVSQNISSQAVFTIAIPVVR
jgi:DNA-binding CsgD family transcriptional regulator/N-acetylneuraminic acid mutarotase